MPVGWTQAEIEEERERRRLEDRAAQERQKRDRGRTVAGGKRLTDPEWDQLEKVLRTISCSRAQICEAMVFCLDKSENAVEIAECVTEALTILETEPSLKLARFMVVSDVLHNTTSAKPAAWAYRREFERSLPDILEHFHVSLSRLESRIQTDKIRDQLVRVLRVWEDWGLFAPQYLRGLEASLVVGVRPLRALSLRGDLSREPGWLIPKLTDWRRMHFSQLEKMCRSRGLRSSTSHLEPTKDLTLEEAKREWLIDRLVCFELHAHDKEQERAAADAAAAKAAAQAAEALRRSRKKARNAKDNEDDEDSGDLDGMPLSESDLDGLALDSDDTLDLLRLAASSNAFVQQNSLRGGLLGCGGTLRRAPVAANAEASREAAAEAPAAPAAASPPAAAPTPAAREDTAAATAAADTAEAEERVRRNIELEVMELRAELQDKGLFRDAVEEIVEEKRKKLLAEHRASLGLPIGDGSEEDGDAPRSSDADEASEARGEDEEEEEEAESGRKQPSEERRGRGRDKEKLRLEAAAAAAKACLGREKEREKKDKEKDKREKEKERSKEKEREKERDKEKEKEKEREKKERDKKEKEREKEKEKEKSRKEPAQKEKEKEKARSRSRSRSGRDRRSRARGGGGGSPSRSRDRKAKSRSRDRRNKERGQKAIRIVSREAAKKKTRR